MAIKDIYTCISASTCASMLYGSNERSCHLDFNVCRRTFNEQETLKVSDPLLSMKGYLQKKKNAEDLFYGRTKEVSFLLVDCCITAIQTC